jgi:ankyrin repeat protein
MNGLLLDSAIKGRFTDVQTALADGADINTKDMMFKGTPLQWASSGGPTEAIKLLLEKGADIKKGILSPL